MSDELKAEEATPVSSHDEKGRVHIDPAAQNDSKLGDNATPLEEPSDGRAEMEAMKAEAAEAEAAEAPLEAEEPAAEEAAEEAEEPAEEEAVEEPAELWGGTGSEEGDAALQLLQSAGVTEEEAKAALYDAAVSGDINKVDIEFLTEKLGAAQAKLVMAGVRQTIADNEAKGQEVRKQVIDVVGDEDTWNKVTDYARKNVPEAELNEYRELISAGGAKARFAAQELVAKYNGDERNSTINAARVEGSSSAPPAVRAISRKEYSEGLAKAMRMQAGPKQEAAVAALQKARNAGKQRGI